MKVDEQNIRKALETIRNGGSYDYAPVKGGIVVFNQAGQRVEKLEDIRLDEINLFLNLRKRGFIDSNQSLHHSHPIFHPSHSNPVEVYRITKEGKEYLEK